MSELSPEARALVEAGRAERPSAAAKAQIKAQVMAQVGAAPVASSAAVGGTMAKLLGGGALTVGVLAGALYLGQGPATPPPAPEPAPVVVTAPPPPPEPTPAPALAPIEAPAAPALRAPVGRVARPRPAAPTVAPSAPAPVEAAGLAEEARLMSRVRRALRDQHPERVLALTAEHAARFPEGALVAERLAAEALAYCAQGDVDAGHAARAALVARAPSSVHLARVDAACARAQQPER